MIYLDANVIIRLVEGVAEVQRDLRARIGEKRTVCAYATSKLTLMECRARPVREKNAALLQAYERFFSGDELLLVDVGDQVIEVATQIRADYSLKGIDAIHLASGVVCGSTVFMTGDRQLARFTGVKVELV